VDFDKTYSQAIGTVRNFVEDIRFKRDLNLNPVKICADKICKFLYTNNNILSILNNVNDKNPYMYSHPVNVAFISFVIGKWLNLMNEELFNLVCSGILHDIGKAKIRDSILNKSGALSELEIETVRSHPTLGYKILAEINIFDTDVLLGVLFHHERQNGTGYPKGLKGEQISLFARIIAIADIYDAMTSTKPYSLKSSPFKVVEEIEANSFGSLDPHICQVFLKNIINFYPGSVVRLNNERVGEIIYINPEERTRPLIHCGNEYINMKKERKLEIVELIAE
jgi:HD-GYP domain-containing protein (c-di-GMP phosphodiesterase class II)